VPSQPPGERRRAPQAPTGASSTSESVTPSARPESRSQRPVGRERRTGGRPRGSGAEGGRPLPPRRLDAPRLHARPGGGAEKDDAPRRPAGEWGPASETPPRRLDAPRGSREQAEPPPPAAARPGIPALWGRPGARPEPPRSDAAAEPAQVRRGQSIAAYKRSQLVEIVGRIAAREPDLTDDQIIELVTRLLDCPEDEALLVGARLRYAVEAYRRRAGRGRPEQ